MADVAARFGAALAMLWAAHDVADHVVQTDHQAANKAQRWSAMAGHVGGYTAVQLLALAALRPLGVRPSVGRLAASVAWSAATHAVLDRRWPVLEILCRTGSEGFAQPHESPADVLVTYGDGLPHVEMPGRDVRLHGPYLADQALHHGCLAVSALILAGGRR